MSTQHSIIKRHGRDSEAYDPDKIERSIFLACVSVRTPEGAAEMAGRLVRRELERWLAARPEVTSADLRRKAGEALLAFNPDAAYIYSKHATPRDPHTSPRRRLLTKTKRS